MFIINNYFWFLHKGWERISWWQRITRREGITRTKRNAGNVWFKGNYYLRRFPRFSISITFNINNPFYESLINFITIDFMQVFHARSLLLPVIFQGRSVRELAARPWQVTIEFFTGTSQLTSPTSLRKEKQNIILAVYVHWHQIWCYH